MAERIPQAVSKLIIFRAYLSSDGKTLATGKIIAITISQNGGAFGNPHVGALNATEISNGFYKFTLDTTDTGTKGPLAWRGAEATINDAGDVMEVVSANNAGFAGVPDAAATAAGGLPVSIAGGLDLDEMNADVESIESYASRTVIRGTVGTTNLTLSTFTVSALDIAGTTVNQFSGRVIIFDKATGTPGLQGEGTAITASTIGALPTFTFNTLTAVPASGDLFSIV